MAHLPNQKPHEQGDPQFSADCILGEKLSIQNLKKGNSSFPREFSKHGPTICGGIKESKRWTGCLESVTSQSCRTIKERGLQHKIRRIRDHSEKVWLDEPKGILIKLGL